MPLSRELIGRRRLEESAGLEAQVRRTPRLARAGPAEAAVGGGGAQSDVDREEAAAAAEGGAVVIYGDVHVT